MLSGWDGIALVVNQGICRLVSVMKCQSRGGCSLEEFALVLKRSKFGTFQRHPLNPFFLHNPTLIFNTVFFGADADVFIEIYDLFLAVASNLNAEIKYLRLGWY